MSTVVPQQIKKVGVHFKDLIAENQRLKMEIEYLKKLSALVLAEEQKNGKKRFAKIDGAAHELYFPADSVKYLAELRGLLPDFSMGSVMK